MDLACYKYEGLLVEKIEGTVRLLEGVDVISLLVLITSAFKTTGKDKKKERKITRRGSGACHSFDRGNQ